VQSTAARTLLLSSIACNAEVRAAADAAGNKFRPSALLKSVLLDIQINLNIQQVLKKVLQLSNVLLCHAQQDINIQLQHGRV
jgi:hypothetical protein